MNNRCQTILSLLTEEQKIDVSALAKKLQVSQVTIRKDLDELERRGIVIREHACAARKTSHTASPITMKKSAALPFVLLSWSRMVRH